MKSIKGNILMNAINTLTGLLYPLVTFPYAARVLLPDGIGEVSFLNSIISYIMLFTSLGIPMYAVKEIAGCRNDIRQRSRIASEILILSFILAAIGYATVRLLAETVPEIREARNLFYILSLQILFTAIGVEWFYQGIEDFKFIAIRAVIVRIVCAASLFIFVKNPGDILIYGLITVGATVGNYIINFLSLGHRLDRDGLRITPKGILRHLRPTLQVFSLSLITSFYLHLNSIMLGFMCGDTEVGYFSAATKVSHIGVTLIASVGTVLLPRCSHLISNGSESEFKSVVNKSLSATMMLSFPLTAGLIILASPIILIFCGAEYSDSILVLRLLAPSILFISITTITGFQVLYPMGRIRMMAISFLWAAVSNLALNFILIPEYGAAGAAVSTSVSELAVVICQMWKGRKLLPFGVRNLFNTIYISATAVMAAATCIATMLTGHVMTSLLLGFLIGVTTYSLMLSLMKDSLFLEILILIKEKLHFNLRSAGRQ